MTRLKYYKRDELLYTDWFTVGPNFIVRGIINTKTNTYQVIEFDSELVNDGQASNLRLAKDRVRALLIKAGVNFEGEIRSNK